MPNYQIVERDSPSADWKLAQILNASTRFETKDEAIEAAKDYITKTNMNNPITAGEKEKTSSLFMIDKIGCFLGNLDGADYYMKYKKDERNQQDRTKVLHGEGEIVKDTTYFELERKSEVSVREVPGT